MKKVKNVSKIDLNKNVVKSNSLIEARSRLTLAEHKLLSCMIAEISSDDTENYKFNFNAQELAKKLGYTDTSDAYREIGKVVKKLQDRRVQYTDRNTGTEIICRWVAGATFNRREGVVKVAFYDDLVPVLFGLKKYFTKIKLEQALSFRSRFSFRIYELLKEFQGIGKRTMEITELREKVGLEEGALRQWNDFKRRVLEIAKKEINKKSDIEIAYTPKKRGRKYHSIEFKIRKNRRKTPPKKPVSSMDNDEKMKRWRVAARKKFARLPADEQQKWIDEAREKSGPDLLGLLGGSDDKPSSIMLQSAAELWAENLDEK